MNKKYITILIVILVLALIGGGVFWYLKQVKQPMNPSVAGNNNQPVKTYTNKVIGIEFDYPTTWPTLISEDRGDILKDGKLSTSFSMPLIDVSTLIHSSLGLGGKSLDNMPINAQFEAIKCQDIKTLVECEERINSNGVKYIWKVYDIGINDQSKAGPQYYVQVATGKYVLVFNFQDKDNYEKRAQEYQQLLSTLKIIE
ncbi:MAG: hypothetical protein Q8Q23_00600 [bacterium]|nr:hypothetical protein [bacterium]